jgi:hypothetical protein
LEIETKKLRIGGSLFSKLKVKSQNFELMKGDDVSKGKKVKIFLEYSFIIYQLLKNNFLPNLKFFLQIYGISFENRLFVCQTLLSIIVP